VAPVPFEAAEERGLLSLHSHVPRISSHPQATRMAPRDFIGRDTRVLFSGGAERDRWSEEILASMSDSLWRGASQASENSPSRRWTATVIDRATWSWRFRHPAGTTT
jgi:hypothetical protein